MKIFIHHYSDSSSDKINKCTCATDFFDATWVQGVPYQKQILGPKLTGVCTRTASQKFGNPYLFL